MSQLPWEERCQNEYDDCPLQEMYQKLKAENAALLEVARAAKRIRDEAQFCFEFCPDYLSDAFMDALAKLDAIRGKSE